MTSHTGRLYALAFGLVVFFLAWTLVAARPWSTTAADPRLKALAAREAQLRHESKLVNQVVAQRWALYRSELRARKTQIALKRVRAAQTAAASVAAPSVAAPSAAAPAAQAVRIVNLPPLTITRTS
ncbi:MAG: hypothetical protein ACXWYO_03815 [Gaiellaceae bacterium]